MSGVGGQQGAASEYGGAGGGPWRRGSVWLSILPYILGGMMGGNKTQSRQLAPSQLAPEDEQPIMEDTESQETVSTFRKDDQINNENMKRLLQILRQR